jgi:hypothetical protein
LGCRRCSRNCNSFCRSSARQDIRGRFYHFRIQLGNLQGCSIEIVRAKNTAVASEQVG